ncbi:MAG TPA: enolase C-terminal domain-like protein [Rhizomicrobium sp.]|nr:enolase C-terminal domain-like protein [Rhizomicrobium sp.]
MTGAKIEALSAAAYEIPTDAPESDGTAEWNSTTLVVCEINAAGATGLGYTYASPAAVTVIGETLASVVRDRDCFAIEAIWRDMIGAVRNLGWRGVCANAISAVDNALWDLKARLLDLPLCDLIGRARDSVAVYGSGGFTSYDDGRLRQQLSGWVGENGCQFVKMKIGRRPEDDLRRVQVARDAIGSAELFVDANGAYTRKQALAFAEAFADIGVTWFEEPVSSDDLEGLRLLRDRSPPGMNVAAGEYGYEPFYFRRMLEAGAVDVLQADATRCCGITGFLRAAALCDAFGLPLSAHTAPAIHLHVACAAPRVMHIEWFYDHVRIERRLFDGAPALIRGRIAPQAGAPGHGLMFKRVDAESFAVKP